MIHRSQMTAILTNLGFEVDGDPCQFGQPFDVIAACRLVAAFDEHEHADYLTNGGTMLPKTKKRRDIERAVFDSLRSLFANHPNQPLGTTDAAVLINLRDAVHKTRRVQ